MWEISGRQVAIATKVSHQATSFFVAGAKWATLSVIARSIDRSRESARRKGAGFHDSAPRACVSLSENVCRDELGAIWLLEQREFSNCLYLFTCERRHRTFWPTHEKAALQ